MHNRWYYKKGWIYAGGDFDEHQNYWKIFSMILFNT